MSSLDPFVKLYRETHCEHGYAYWHETTEWSGKRDDLIQCPGGSREEVTIDYEAAAEAIDETLSDYLRGNDSVWLVDPRKVARSIVDAALKNAGFTKKFASGESSTE